MDALGILLIGAAIALFFAEAILPTGGFVGVLGIASLVAGMIMLDVAWWVIALVVIAIVAVGVFLTVKVYRSQRQERVLTGWEELIGAEGDVRVALAPSGHVFVNGTLWKAQVDEGLAPVDVGTRVRVREVDGLTLKVEAAQ